jgi:hypothetical protein
MTFLSSKIIKKGEILWNNYGPKGNEVNIFKYLESRVSVNDFQNLLFNYGFVLTDNPLDYHKLALTVPPTDPHHSLKMSLLSTTHSRAHLLFASDTSLSPSFIESAEVVISKDFELNSLTSMAIEQPSSLSSPRRTIQTLLSIWLMLTTKRQMLPQIPKSSSDNIPIQRICHIYVQGQSTILDHHLMLAKKELNETLASSLIFFHARSIDVDTLFRDRVLDLGLDEDTVLALVLIHEFRRGIVGVPWTSFYGPGDDDIIGRVLGYGSLYCKYIL